MACRVTAVTTPTALSSLRSHTFHSISALQSHIVPCSFLLPASLNHACGKVGRSLSAGTTTRGGSGSFRDGLPPLCFFDRVEPSAVLLSRSRHGAQSEEDVQQGQLQQRTLDESSALCPLTRSADIRRVLVCGCDISQLRRIILNQPHAKTATAGGKAGKRVHHPSLHRLCRLVRL